MNCNMCGKEDQLFNTKIEGTVLQICKSCARYGQIVSPIRSGGVFRRPQRMEKPENQDFVVENYASLMRSGRQSKGLDQEEFAKKINERLSVVSSAESGKHTPSVNLARKIGQFLGIRLVEEVPLNEKLPEMSKPKEKSEGFTLADFIKKKKN